VPKSKHRRKGKERYSPKLPPRRDYQLASEGLSVIARLQDKYGDNWRDITHEQFLAAISELMDGEDGGQPPPRLIANN
jgi:hypothetical protein